MGRGTAKGTKVLLMESDATHSAASSAAQERRSEQRYPSEDEAIVTILACDSSPSGDPAGGEEAPSGAVRQDPGRMTTGSVCQGRTVDISKSGLRVRIQQPLEVGSKIRIKFGTTFAFGTVRWCSQVNGIDYDCGILVEHTLAQSLVESVHQALDRVRKSR